MDCQKLDETLYELVSGTVDGAVQAACDAHAGSCARCRAEIAQYRETVRLMASVKMPDMPEGFWERQRARVMEVVHRVVAMRPWKAPPLSLAALLLLVGIYGLAGVDGLTGLGRDVTIPDHPTSTFHLTLIPIYVFMLGLAMYSFREKATPRQNLPSGRR